MAEDGRGYKFPRAQQDRNVPIYERSVTGPLIGLELRAPAGQRDSAKVTIRPNPGTVCGNQASSLPTTTGRTRTGQYHLRCHQW
jgi:hypothetical protein